MIAASYIFVLILFFGSLFAIVLWLVGRAKAKQKDLIAFANAHGGEYQGRTTLGETTSLSIDSRDVFDHISMPEKAEYFSYGSKAYYIASLTFDYGHILIRPISDNAVQTTLPKGKPYAMEGSMGDVFEVYFVDGQSATALQFLEPTTMEYILSEFPDSSIELLDSRVIIASSFDSNYSDQIIKFIKNAQQLVTKIERGHGKGAGVIQKQLEQVVPNTHLKRSSLVGVSVGIICLGLLVSFIIPPTFAGPLVLALIIISIIGYVIMRKRLPRRND